MQRITEIIRIIRLLWLKKINLKHSRMKLDRCLILENKISQIEIKGIKPNYKIRIS